MSLHADDLEAAALLFMREIEALKQAIDPTFPWYPYGILNNFIHLKPIFHGFPLGTLISGRAVLDIGAADGDLAFFLEKLGYAAEIIDHAPTNFNGLRGARLLSRHLASSIPINDIDLDSYFLLPDTRYDLVFFLGILYHLKNPFLVMESLSKVTRHLLVSTRVARFAPQGQPIHEIPVAYLLHPTESNNDSTNYWTFSEAGLLRLFERTGWDVLTCRTIGDTIRSDPASLDHDERAFTLLRSRSVSAA
ncbi:class I SAM-dependent methyltransferase [Rhodopila sp.]|uniref:class I SAM-dependent methyltransferase n=1 Tax=Rhodopila sp. TaxID=2480087 RepID=UPI003D09C87D